MREEGRGPPLLRRRPLFLFPYFHVASFQLGSLLVPNPTPSPPSFPPSFPAPLPPSPPTWPSCLGMPEVHRSVQTPPRTVPPPHASGQPPISKACFHRSCRRGRGRPPSWWRRWKGKGRREEAEPTHAATTPRRTRRREWRA